MRRRNQRAYRKRASSIHRCIESLEARTLLTAAFDLTGLTAMRADPTYAGIDGSGVTVAVLDTGIFAQHPELQSNVIAWYNAVENPVPDSLPVDRGLSGAFDHNGHGTHVAGTVASVNTSIGVAPAARIVAIHALADAGEYTLTGSPQLRGLRFVEKFAAELGIRVVNMSIGTFSASGGLNTNAVPPASDESLEVRRLESLGLTVVSSSGNSYANAAAPGASLPAVYSTISVANTWADTGRPGDFGLPFGGSSSDQYFAVERDAAPDRLAATSQRSSLSNQLAAPGQDTYSTWNGTGGSLYQTESGTSMASPFVAGTVALMQDAAYSFGGRYLSDPNQILQILRDTADWITDSNVATNARFAASNGALTNLPETGFSFARVNVYHAIQRVRQLMLATAVPATHDADATPASATEVPDLTGMQFFTYTGDIGHDGQVSVSSNDIDLFAIQLASRGEIRIQLTPTSGSSLASTLRFFDANGSQLGSSSGQTPGLQSTAGIALSAGTYYLGVSSQGNSSYALGSNPGATGGVTTGGYQLTIGLINPDPNGVKQGAVDIDLTAPTVLFPGSTNSSASAAFGTLGSDPPAAGTTTRIQVPNGDVDMFRVVAPDTGLLTIDTEAQSVYGTNGADTYLRIFNSAMTEIASNDDKTLGVSTDSFVQAPIALGQTYYIAVTNYANRSFDPIDPYNRVAASTAVAKQYDLYLNFTTNDQNGTVYSATPLAISTAINDRIGADGTNSNSGSGAGARDVDFFRFSATQTGLFDAVVSRTDSSSLNPVATLWYVDQGTGKLYPMGQSDSGELAFEINPSDQFYISVADARNQGFNGVAIASGTGGNTGAYSLSTTLYNITTMHASDDYISGASVTTLQVDQPQVASLWADGPLLVGSDDVDIYKFVATTSGQYVIQTDTSQEGSADTVLRVFDASGAELAWNDDASNATTGSTIQINLRAGQTYFIGVNGFSATAREYDAVSGANAADGSTGNYVLSVTLTVPTLRSLAAPYFDEAFYRATNPDVAAVVDAGRFPSLFDHFLLYGQKEGRQPDPFFNENRYLALNPDIRPAIQSGLFASGFEHFVRYGQEEGRLTSAFFNEAYYLATYPEINAVVNAGGMHSGFEHYVEYGNAEGRNPSPWFNEKLYRDANADVAAVINPAGIRSGLQHYLLFGEKEGRNPSPFFNESYYRSHNPDLAPFIASGTFASGYEHFVLYGHTDDRDFSPLFKEQLYLDANTDVAGAVSAGLIGSGFLHYIQYGAKEGRNPSAFFNESYYRQRNPDLLPSITSGGFLCGFEHFILYGDAEHRRFSPGFTDREYLALNPPLAAAVNAGAFISGFDHFMEYGYAEKRLVQPFFDEAGYLTRYPTIAAWVASEPFRSGFEHYLLWGDAQGFQGLP